ncbi:unnamed protein product [Hyaloperonospora brassicae]|uniref:Uncharacterized protein n=1 Tax=Hyaloperonospora brassicae TaxID=162125 RepID=A0AAV0U5K7_HYABA|nr:unnamed protein product [Hyaloperonospora brassicae]
MWSLLLLVLGVCVAFLQDKRTLRVEATTHTAARKAQTREGHSARGTSDWPSLLLHFTVKRSSMSLYGHSKFTMYATPIVSTARSRVMFDVYATVHDDKTAYNYTLVNGVAYLQSDPLVARSFPRSVRCVQSDFVDFPPIASILDALNEAVPVAELSGSIGSTIDCEGDSIYKVSVDGFDFALCASEHEGFKMYGSDMDIEVEYLDTRVRVVAPVVALDDDDDDDSAKLKCPGAL